MGMLALMGALCRCAFGVAPSPLTVLPTKMVTGKNMPIATIMDYIPMLNIMPFAMCQNIANPAVLAATVAAAGVLTPMPCVPVTTAPWIPLNPTLLLKNLPVLNDSAMAMCSWGGPIQILFPGLSMCTLS